LLDLNRRCRRSDSVVFRKINTEAILVPIRGDVADLENIYTLNEAGQFIWHILDGKRTVKDVCEAIITEFEVTAEQSRTDVLEFLGEMVSVKLVEVA